MVEKDIDYDGAEEHEADGDVESRKQQRSANDLDQCHNGKVATFVQSNNEVGGVARFKFGGGRELQEMV